MSKSSHLLYSSSMTPPQTSSSPPADPTPVVEETEAVEEALSIVVGSSLIFAARIQGIGSDWLAPCITNKNRLFFKNCGIDNIMTIFLGKTNLRIEKKTLDPTSKINLVTE